MAFWIFKACLGVRLRSKSEFNTQKTRLKRKKKLCLASKSLKMRNFYQKMFYLFIFKKT